MSIEIKKEIKKMTIEDQNKIIKKILKIKDENKIYYIKENKIFLYE
mgnify:CR=1 FL=1